MFPHLSCCYSACTATVAKTSTAAAFQVMCVVTLDCQWWWRQDVVLRVPHASKLLFKVIVFCTFGICQLHLSLCLVCAYLVQDLARHFAILPCVHHDLLQGAPVELPL